MSELFVLDSSPSICLRQLSYSEVSARELRPRVNPPNRSQLKYPPPDRIYQVPRLQTQDSTCNRCRPGNGLIHIVPFGKVSSAIQKGFAPGGAHLTYFGGPVISNIHVVAVFWGPNVNTAITGAPGVSQFFTDITTSRYYDLLSEYSTVGVTGIWNAGNEQQSEYRTWDV